MNSWLLNQRMMAQRLIKAATPAKMPASTARCNMLDGSNPLAALATPPPCFRSLGASSAVAPRMMGVAVRKENRAASL